MNDYSVCFNEVKFRGDDMTFEKILVEKLGNIALITLNDCENRNALSTQMTEELLIALTNANEREDIQAIVLTGAGNTFCSGGNLMEFQQFIKMGIADLYEDGLNSTKLFQIREQMKKPIIGAINGAALGGGTGLVSLCHIAIGCEHTKLGLTELKLGLVPYVILPLVRRVVGERKMMELMLTARVISSEESQTLGFLSQVVPTEQLLEFTLKQAQQIASYSPLAVKMALRAFEKTAEMGVSESMDILTTMRLVSFKSDDLKEGASAFLEKRSPVWQGR